MHPLPALFVDTRRNTPLTDSLPEHGFSMAYIVGGTMEQSSAFFQTHHRALTTIPHITFEVTEQDTLHLATRIPSLTRLSLPCEWLLPDLENFFEIDAIIHWDHRKSLNHYTDILHTLCMRRINHISLYGLQDFETWQIIQDFIQPFGFSFYERFHAARDNQQSLYQNHISAAHDVIAWGGWSRYTDDDGVMHVRGPRAKRWTTLTTEQTFAEIVILGIGSRHGIDYTSLSPHIIQRVVTENLAHIENERLIPTDLGLWHTTALADYIL
jgi:hypothetical protein